MQIKLSFKKVFAVIFTGFLAVWMMGSAMASPSLVPMNLADEVEKLTPAVVNISTTKKIGGEVPKSGQKMFPPGHPFENFNEFFEHFGGMGMGQGMKREARSLGSGFVIDPSGFVVTNFHVIDGADAVTVTFDDEREFAAEIKGVDPKTDLAVLKIEADTPLPYVSFGDSDASRVGDWVVVIGNPFGLGGTVTTGIISAKARDIHAGPFDDFIQTDAAINRGNSGGPMFNLNGEVIGINTAIYSPSGGNVGIGFAVPSGMARPIIAQLKEGQTIERGWLGVKIQHVTKEIADSLGMESGHGALVADVVKDSPAARAGVRQGDVILSYNGQDIMEMRDLPRMVAGTEVGHDAQIIVLRGGDKKELSVTIAKLDESAEEVVASMPVDKDALLGLVLKPVNDILKQQFNLPEDAKGLVVVAVNRESEAALRGIRPGDVVVEINQQPAKDVAVVEDALKVAEEKGRGSVLLLILRNGETLFQALPLDEK